MANIVSPMRDMQRTNNLQDQVNRLEEEIQLLTTSVKKYNNDLNNIAIWILGLFTLFIPQIIFAIKRGIYQAKLNTLQIEVQKVNGRINVLQQDSVNNSRNGQGRKPSSQIRHRPSESGVLRGLAVPTVNFTSHPLTTVEKPKNPAPRAKMTQNAVPSNSEVAKTAAATSVAGDGLWDNAEQLIRHMRNMVAWSKTKEGQEELAEAKRPLLSDQFCVSNILPNLDLGGLACHRGIINHGENTLMGKRGTKDSTPELVTNRLNGYLINIWFLDPNDLPQLKRMAERFTPYIAFEGGGIYGYVYSTNGRGLNIQGGGVFDSLGNLTSTVNAYLKPEYLTNEAKTDRFIDGELFFNFGSEQKETNYADILQSIDKAVSILNMQEKSNNPEPMIVHCSSGMERSVTTAIAIILRNLQRQGQQITEELIELTTEFLQARRADASKFDDPLPEDFLKKDLTKSVNEMRKRLINFLISHPPVKQE